MGLQDFRKNHRLLKKKDFEPLKVRSFKKVTSFLVFYFAQRELSLSIETRIGISCSKKVGNAVKRNLIKRTIREWFRKSPYKGLKSDILISVSYRASSLSSARELKETVTFCLEQGFQKISEKLGSKSESA